MKAKIDNKVLNLITGHKHWFDSSSNPSDLINQVVESSINGVYCIWWKDPNTFPETKTVDLPAGSRGVVSLVLKSWKSELTDNIALYVGKGKVRTRLSSHIKSNINAEDKKSRNPYQWLATIFDGQDIERLIMENLGFSFIEKPNKLEQIYTENLAIGILHPWFNLRLTA
jgi:hypothetical protein